LVRGNNVHSSGLPTQLNARSHVQPFTVNWNGYKSASRQLEDSLRQQISRFLDPDGTACVQQYASSNLESLLRTSDNHDLMGIAANATRGPEISANGVAKFFRTKRISLIERTYARAPAVP
jgi:hypothetical protein